MSAQAIGLSLNNFQAALNQGGETFEQFIRSTYIDRWMGADIYHLMLIRTTFVNAMHNFLSDRGLMNMERVQMSPVTDPLAHDVEHTPFIEYKGCAYQTTHSMIYSKFLACMNPAVKGIFVDSPNIRLELESPRGKQRNKYVIDFSQMDVEVRRGRKIQLEEYLSEPEKVRDILREDMALALDFFEDMIIHTVTEVVEKNDENLKALGVALEVPAKPFPRFSKDEAAAQHNLSNLEAELGKVAGHPFFWVTGLMRENYDLIYPYLMKDGTRRDISEFTSDQIYNYDLCAQSLNRNTNTYGSAYEILSGAIREWLYEPVVWRLVDNKVIPAAPIIKGGNVENMAELGGYGPFLMVVSQKDENGESVFPDTFGGGIGIERALFTLCLGDKIRKVDDVMLFGKNPDSHPIYLF